MYPVIEINTSWKHAAKHEPVSFDAGSSYDPDGYIVSYQWDFGDGSGDHGFATQHAFANAGRYSVKLTVTDNDGGQRSAYMTVIVDNNPPVSVPGDNINATVGETVSLNGSASYDPDGHVVKYEWSFGDSTFGQGAIVTHTYNRPDKYEVDLKVTDDDGLNSTAYLTVNVVAGATPTPIPAQPGSQQGMLLLGGAAIACASMLLVMWKRSK